jgi:hypothetical protein
MKCPHCLVEFHDEDEITFLQQDSDGPWFINKLHCPNPNCKRFIIYLINATDYDKPQAARWKIHSYKKKLLVYPKTHSRKPVPTEVPNAFATDYTEACLVLTDSSKASAALSRRCLQNILREKASVKKGDLATEIQQVLDSGQLPTYLAGSIDAIRNIGNFAAHPSKSTSSGEIVNVEPGEAEWNLEVLESLFDFYFVQPEILRVKKEALNEKLKSMGKPEMK